MSIGPIGYVDYFNAPVYANRSFGSRADQSRSVNPFADPQQNRTTSTAAAATGVVGTLATIALAIAFRGKIKGGLAKLVKVLKPYVPKSIKKVLKGGLKYVESAYTAVKKHLPKGVKKFIKDTYKFVTKYIDAGAKFIKKYTYDPLKKLFSKAPAAPATPTP
jgi:hypothetical protein